MAIEPGDLLQQRYRILSILGQGGMGAVYCAMDEHLGVMVAVKENLFLSEEYTRQFRREATILANLRHPNLPHVRDHFLIENQGQYLVMDYIDGEDLRERMERIGKLPDEEIVRIGAAICDALTYLHTRVPPVIHRDIKPGNIKITAEGQIALVDFGLAKIFEDNQETTTGARAMTPGYSPPEQYGTARTDPRSDIYSLGATLYAAAADKIPEDGLARTTGYATLTEIRKLNPRISRQLAQVIQKALELQPADRYQSAEEFKLALLEAGNALKLNTPAITIAPPPPTVEGIPSRPLMRDSTSHPSQSPPLPPRPAKKKIAWGWMALSIFVLAGIILSAAEKLNLMSGGWAASLHPIPISHQTAGPTPSGAIPLPTPTSSRSATATLEPTRFVSPTSPAGGATTPHLPFVLPPSPQPSLVKDQRNDIVFVSNRTGLPQLWIMASDGSRQWQLTNITEGACQPDWSPDGKKIIFISPCLKKDVEYPGATLHIIDLTTQEVTDLPFSPEGDFDPAWSPDGKSIAFTSLRSGMAQIYRMGVDDKSVEQLTKANYKSRQPAWSPDGQRIVFSRVIGTAQIWILVTSDGLSTAYAVNENVNNTVPAWSPNGKVIYFNQASYNSIAARMVGIRYDPTSHPTEFQIPAVLDKQLGPVNGVSVSPDDRLLLFESWPDGKNHDLFTMTVNGTNITRLTSDAKLDFDAVWRPTFLTP